MMYLLIMQVIMCLCSILLFGNGEEEHVHGSDTLFESTKFQRHMVSFKVLIIKTDYNV